MVSSVGTNFVSGLASGIDFASLVDQIIQAESGAVEQLQGKQSDLVDKKDLYESLNSLALSLAGKAEDLRKAEAFNQFKTSLSSPTTTKPEDILGVTVSKTALPGTFSVVVEQLAEARKIQSKEFTSLDTALNLSGEFLLNGKVIALQTSDTLSNLLNKINGANSGTSPTGVTASILTVGTKEFRLVLTDDSTGKDGFSLQAADSSDLLFSGLGFFVAGSSAKVIKNATSDGAKSDTFTSSTAAVGTLLGLTSAPSSATITVGDKSTVNINLATMSLNDIKTAIDTAAPTGVTTQVVSETVDGTTVFRLDISGTTPFTDSNNVLETLGVLKRNGLTAAQEYKGSVANTAAASPVTSATLFSAIDGTSIQTNETITITGKDVNGTAVSGTFTIDHANSTKDDLGDLETFIEGLFTSGQVNVTYDASGKLTATQTTTGETQFTLTVVANNEQGGKLDFGNLSVTTRGRTAIVQAGQDSAVTVDGVRLERSSNSISDAVTGVTLDLLKASSADTLTVQVNRDFDQLRVDVENLFNDYNSIIDFINTQSTFDPVTDAEAPTLLGEFTLVSFKEMLQTDVVGSILGLPTDRNILAHVGIESDQDGKITVDATKFKDAFQADFLGSRRVFIGEGTTTDGDVDFVSLTNKTQAGTFDVNITQAATQAAVTGTTDLSGGLGANDTVTITDKSTGRKASVALTTGQSLTSAVNALNSAFATELAQAVTGSIANTTDGSTAITASTTFSSIFGASVVANDTIDISGTTKLGKAVSGVFTVTDPTTSTVGQLLSAIETAFGNTVTATVNTAGKIVVTDTSVGDSSLSVTLVEKNEGGGTLDFGLTGDPSEVTTTGRFKMEITASASGNFLKLAHDNYGSTLGFTIAQTSNQLGITDQEYVGKDVAGTINGETATGSGRTLTGKAGQANIDGLTLLVTISASDLTSQGAAQGSVKITTGVAEKLDRLLDSVTDTVEKGLLANQIKSLGDSIDDTQDLIDEMNRRLEVKRVRLTNQFIAMEQSLSRLRTLGDFLSQQLAAL
ncbi:MAG: flagellar filament capping protein FliD [Nitrospinota bacterium]